MLVSLVLLGSVLLVREEWKQFGKHLAGAAAFVSNLVLWSEAGYFDNSAETKPLLHLWSLGIEEQCYLVYPLLLWLGWKTRVNLFGIMAAVFLISFGCNVIEMGKDASYQFYSPQTRFWELMIGSMLAYVTEKRSAMPSSAHDMTLVRFPASGLLSALSGKTSRNVWAAGGLGLILTGVAIITANNGYPGMLALLPTLGSAILIGSGPHTAIARWILTLPIVVWIGLISYPLYLWHWPLLAFLRLAHGETPPASQRVAVVLLSVCLAWMTTKLIEPALRSGGGNRIKSIALLCSLTVIGSVGYWVHRNDGRLVATSSLLALEQSSSPPQPSLSESSEPNPTLSGGVAAKTELAETARTVKPSLTPPAPDEKSSHLSDSAPAAKQPESPVKNETEPDLSPPSFGDAKVELPPGIANDGDITHEAFHSYIAERFYPCTPAEIYSAAIPFNSTVRCQQSKPTGPIDFVLIGDSHAEHLFPGLAEMLPNRNVGFYILNGLPLLSNPQFKLIFDTVAGSRAVRTVMVTWWYFHRGVPKEDLNQTVQALAAKGRTIYLTDDLPTFHIDMAACKYLARIPGASPKCSQEIALMREDPFLYPHTYAANMKTLNEVVQDLPQLRMISTMAYFCRDEVCYMGGGGRIFYRDGHHLNLLGSRLVGRRILTDHPELRR